MSRKSVKAYAAIPFGVMGGKNLALLDKVHGIEQEGRRSNEYMGLYYFLVSLVHAVTPCASIM